MNTNENDVNNKMDLNFENQDNNLQSENETNIKVQSNNDGTIEYLIDKTNEMNINLKMDKIENKEVLINKKKEKMPTKNLLLMIGWIFILILSIIFGADAIRLFVDKIDKFINAVNDDNDNMEQKLSATGAFFSMIAYAFEAVLFIFFIVYSSKKIVKNYIPFGKYRKETKPIRDENNLNKLKKTNSKLTKAYRKYNINYHEQNFANQTTTSQIKSYKGENKILKNELKKHKKEEKENKK